MKSQDTLIIHPETVEQANALKAFMAAFKIKFEISKEEDVSYDEKFVAKIQNSRKQAVEGKTVNIDLDDIWKE